MTKTEILNYHEVVVAVNWQDIVSHSCWKTEEEYLEEKPASCVSYGELRYDKRGWIYLINSIAQNGETDYGVLVIPVGCITKITRLIGE